MQIGVNCTSNYRLLVHCLLLLKLKFDCQHLFYFRPIQTHLKKPVPTVETVILVRCNSGIYNYVHVKVRRGTLFNTLHYTTACGVERCSTHYIALRPAAWNVVQHITLHYGLRRGTLFNTLRCRKERCRFHQVIQCCAQCCRFQHVAVRRVTL